MKVDGIRAVAERHLCCGCGACAYIAPDAITMVDDLDQGRRPIVATVGDADVPTSEALAVCPGLEIRAPQIPPGIVDDLLEDWGPVLELWEGAATDPEMRYSGSSGGVATALAWHSLEGERMHGILHTAARPDVPYLNHTVLSTTREELLDATGSRYAPASPCDGLDRIANSPGPCVFVGKPCDVAGAVRAAGVRPELAGRLGLTVAIFCAGTPTTRGTLELLRATGIEPVDVASIRYRGNGWPGDATVTTTRTGKLESSQLSYDESWNKILQKHRQWRCYVCADHTGELADISVGDPWYREIPADEPGLSLVVVRTERGRQVLHRAMAAGAVELVEVASDVLPASQPNLRRARGAAWGRSVAVRLVGVPAPRYPGMAVFGSWRKALTGRQKLQSFIGTLKRVRTKALWHRQPVDSHVPGRA